MHMVMRLFTVLFATVAIAAACSDEGRNVPFTEARNYFVRNDAVLPLESPVICSQAELDSLFGMAAVMGRNGRPTDIDFDREFCVAYVIPPTDTLTEIVPVSVTSKGKELTCNFQIKKGDPITWTIQPFSLIVIDRSYFKKQVKVKVN